MTREEVIEAIVEAKYSAHVIAHNTRKSRKAREGANYRRADAVRDPDFGDLKRIARTTRLTPKMKKSLKQWHKDFSTKNYERP